MSRSKADPLVTVIIATYNSSQTLKLAIETVLAQDFSDFEIWVVGDACTDNSEKVVLSFNDKRLNWINLPENSGSQGFPNNEGIRRARGKYIAYLGHDDLWFPWHLSTLVRFIKETKADLVHPLSAVYSPSGLERISGPPSIGRSYAIQGVSPSLWLHRKEIVKDVGYWGDHLKLNRGVDVDYLKRIYCKKKKIECIAVLSHLKFPSWAWGVYSIDYYPGQQEFYRRLKVDPENLEKEVLTEAAHLLARRFFLRLPAIKVLKEFFKILIQRLMEIYGTERWPLKQLLFRRFQRYKKVLKKKRGLASKD